MVVFDGRAGDRLRVGTAFALAVLEVSRGHAKLGLTMSAAEATGEPINRCPVVDAKCRGYYRFARDGVCTLVLDRTKGDRIRIDEADEIVVLDVHSGSVQLGCGHAIEASSR